MRSCNTRLIDTRWRSGGMGRTSGRRRFGFDCEPVVLKGCSHRGSRQAAQNPPQFRAKFRSVPAKAHTHPFNKLVFSDASDCLRSATQNQSLAGTLRARFFERFRLTWCV
jgi:hypothetical protein